MLRSAIVALRARLSCHSSLSKSRLETLCALVVAMVSARTVNLSHLASEMPGEALLASCYRRLQRFFQHERLHSDWSAPLIVKLMRLSGRYTLCLDRTNWKIGRRDVNILMLALATPRFRVPLLWSVLDKAGMSDTPERIALMERYLALFGAATIEVLLADREFIGYKWLDFLDDRRIPFAIRLKEERLFVDDAGRSISFTSLMRKAHAERHFAGRLTGSDRSFNFAAKPIKGGEILVVVTNGKAKKALAAYAKRWAVECLFGDAKTRGLNLEDTHLTDPDKLDTLLVVVALAIAWANKAATKVMGRAEINVKKHGYKAKSWFRTGFDHLRRTLRTDPVEAIKLWKQLAPKTAGVV
jgi:hypothetical protein